MYNTLPRSVHASSTFPKHVFVRAANFESNIVDRVGNRDSCFKSTLLHLTERFQGKDVYLVGTCNQSTLLAQRTKKLIEELKPDVVMVQTSQEWANVVKTLKYVDNQDEMNKYAERLDRYLHEPRDSYLWFPFRHWIREARLGVYYLLFRNFFDFAREFRFERPGLECKFALEAAEQVGAKVGFLGAELDN